MQRRQDASPGNVSVSVPPQPNMSGHTESKSESLRVVKLARIEIEQADVRVTERRASLEEIAVGARAAPVDVLGTSLIGTGIGRDSAIAIAAAQLEEFAPREAVATIGQFVSENFAAATPFAVGFVGEGRVNVRARCGKAHVVLGIERSARCGVRLDRRGVDGLTTGEGHHRIRSIPFMNRRW